MSEVTEKIVCGATSDTYDRFKTTVQHSLGNEVSWNSLAMLFYTTKGVVTAVGMGTQLASAAKEMTLRYFSDKFAGWLMDRGGFVRSMSSLYCVFPVYRLKHCLVVTLP